MHVGKDAIGEDDGDGVCEVHAGVALDGKTVEHADVAISKHAYEVEGIDAEVEQCTAAEVWTHDTLLVAHRVAKGGCDEVGSADATVGNQLANDSHDGLVARPDGLSEEYATLVSEVEYFLGLPCVGHEGFFYQTGLAGFYRRLRHVVVV